MIRLALAGATVLLVGGCSLAPDFTKPEAAMPESWASETLAAGDRIPTDWWRTFDDPALVNLVNEALGANADLLLAAARVAESRALLSGRQAEQYPLLEIEGAAARRGPSEEAPTAAASRGKAYNDLQVSSVGDLRAGSLGAARECQRGSAGAASGQRCQP